MRNVILLIFMMIWSFCTISAQKNNMKVCRLGFDYEISQSNNWGKNKPVVKHITPYSSAELAGLKAFDIIEMIDGVAVTDIAIDEIPQLLNPVNESEVLLTVRNITSDEKRILIKKDCKKMNAITEEQLAVAYGMYSTETTYDREFICPFKTTVTTDPVDLANFHTFAFAPIDESNRELETVINETIKKELSKRGLREDVVQPDIMIQTFYFFDKNPNYIGKNKVQLNKEKSYRFDISHNKMEEFPFLSSSASETEAEYLLQFGIRMIDHKEVKDRLLWECESNELLEKSFHLDDYARIHVPLMCLQYPYVKYTNNVPFTINKLSYNYTGIQYDIDQLNLVVSVDPNSPAHLAGVRVNDVIKSINNHPMNYSAEEFSEAFKKFIAFTLPSRDTSTLFTNTSGFKYCMSWDSSEYAMIAETAQQEEFLPAFSYLYFFTPYINPSGNNACTFVVQQKTRESEIIIRPTIRTELTVEVK